MAQTAGGTYYAASSELVSSWPATSLDLANQLESRFAAKLAYVRQASAPTGAYGVIWIDTSTSALNSYQWNGSAWVPFSRGRATYSGTTGSPTITTVSGKTCIKFTGSGSITIASAGLLDALIVGGGGGGATGSGSGGGGGGGVIYKTDFYVPSGTLTVTVGAGGASTGGGGESSIGGLIAPGGGCFQGIYRSGASGAGAGGLKNASGWGGITGLGYPGGNNSTLYDYEGGGGGGAGGSGANTGANYASGANGKGGAGVSNSITGSAVTYGAGGGGGSNVSGGADAGGTGAGKGGAWNAAPVSGTANTGGGGGGWGATGAGATGGSGVLILLLG